MHFVSGWGCSEVKRPNLCKRHSVGGGACVPQVQGGEEEEGRAACGATREVIQLDSSALNTVWSPLLSQGPYPH